LTAQRHSPQKGFSGEDRIIGDFPLDEFLRDFFQKKPLFLPGALAGFRSPVDAETLAGLTLEEEVESRLVEHTRAPKAGSKKRPWTLKEGPFEERLFENLAKADWTLLVQDVDKLLPEVHALLSLVSFLPRWSIDDIMISYAAPGGSVGPHTDRYDVFLLQAQGSRTWEINTGIIDESLRSDTPLKVLKHFEAEQRYTAHPGDVLYLPAGVAHFGVAVDECMTYSFGFRAPSEERVLATILSEIYARKGERLFRQGAPSASTAHSELSSDLFQQFDKLLTSFATDSDPQLRHAALGRFLSEPKNHLLGDAPECGVSSEEIKRAIFDGSTLVRDLTSRFLFSTTGPKNATLFLNGIDHSLDGFAHAAALARVLCENQELNADNLNPWTTEASAHLLWEILASLLDDGALRLHREPEVT
jgi:50S ribosomal protein L16 3-hydroxylase